MSKDIDYGKLTKRIVFTDNDHRHAQLIVALRTDGLTQAAFFRHLITGYIENDERIRQFVDEVKPQSRKRKAQSSQLRAKGREDFSAHGFSEDQVESIFDLIEEENSLL